jgi:hypothetical protein
VMQTYSCAPVVPTAAESVPMIWRPTQSTRSKVLKVFILSAAHLISYYRGENGSGYLPASESVVNLDIDVECSLLVLEK